MVDCDTEDFNRVLDMIILFASLMVVGVVLILLVAVEWRLIRLALSTKYWSPRGIEC